MQCLKNHYEIVGVRGAEKMFKDLLQKTIKKEVSWQMLFASPPKKIYVYMILVVRLGFFEK
jgi:hypothetical protein